MRNFAIGCVNGVYGVFKVFIIGSIFMFNTRVIEHLQKDRAPI